MKATAKRRRSRLEIQEEKRKEQEEKLAVQQRLQQIEDLKGEIASMNGKMGMAGNLHTQVQNLINSGFVKQSQNSNLIPIFDEEEREQ